FAHRAGRYNPMWHSGMKRRFKGGSGLGSRAHGTRRIAAPVAPRAFVEQRAREARELEREDALACVDAAAAIARDARRAVRTERLERFAQCRRLEETRIVRRAHVARVRPALSAWHVARSGIDRLDLALVALGGARVDEERSRIVTHALD